MEEVYDDQSEGLLASKPDQNQEIPFDRLSGDEAMELSMAANSFSRSGQARGKTKFFATSVVVAKSILGVGILGLPAVAKEFGVIPTVVLILIFYFQTQYCTTLMLKSKNLSSRSNLSTIGYEVFRTKNILTFINLIIIINNFGLCFAEMTIQATTITNIMKQIVKGDAWYKSKYFLSPVSALIMSPLMVIDKIEKLKQAGILALFAMIVFALTIVIASINQAGDIQGFDMFPKHFSFERAFAAFPTLLLAYNWEFNLFPVYKGMLKPSDRGIMQVTYAGMAMATTCYFIVMLNGYALFGEKTTTNLLKQITPEIVSLPAFYILNGAFYLSTLLTTPLVFYGARNNFLQLIGSGKGKVKTHQVNQSSSSSEIIVSDKKKRKRQAKLRYCCWSLTLFALIVLGAVLIDRLETAFNIVGSVSSNSIGCVLPSLFYYKLVEQKVKQFKLTGWEATQYHFARLFFVYSVIMSFVCLTSGFLSLRN